MVTHIACAEAFGCFTRGFKLDIALPKTNTDLQLLDIGIHELFAFFDRREGDRQSSLATTKNQSSSDMLTQDYTPHCDSNNSKDSRRLIFHSRLRLLSHSPILLFSELVHVFFSSSAPMLRLTPLSLSLLLLWAVAGRLKWMGWLRREGGLWAAEVAGSVDTVRVR